MKALMRFAGLEDPVLSRPFTVVDPKGEVWTIATDKVWLVAAKGKSWGPRFQGEATSYTTLLNLIRMEPEGSAVTFDRNEALSRFQPEHLVSILGVVVSGKRIEDILKATPVNLAWTATPFVKMPSLGFGCEGWRVLLMGFENVIGEVPEFSLLSPERAQFDLMMGLD